MLFGNAIIRYLLKEGCDISYSEMDELEQASKDKLIISKKDVENKKLIIVDSAIYSGKTYNFIMGRVNKERRSLKIKGVVYVVDKDLAGLANFSKV